MQAADGNADERLERVGGVVALGIGGVVSGVGKDGRGGRIGDGEERSWYTHGVMKIPSHETQL